LFLSLPQGASIENKPFWGQANSTPRLVAAQGSCLLERVPRQQCSELYKGGHISIGKTRGFEINLHLYKIVHIDDQDILFERVK